MAIEAAIEAAIAAADPERFRGPFHQLAVSVNHARHPFAFIPRHRGQRERETGERRKRVERKRGQKNGEGRTGQRSTALGARKKAIEGSSREEEGEEITKQQGDLAMEFS